MTNGIDPEVLAEPKADTEPAPAQPPPPATRLPDDAPLPNALVAALARFVARVQHRIDRTELEDCVEEAKRDGQDPRFVADDYSTGIAAAVLSGWDVDSAYEAEAVRRTAGAEQRATRMEQATRVALGKLERATAHARAYLLHADTEIEETRAALGMSARRGG